MAIDYFAEKVKEESRKDPDYYKIVFILTSGDIIGLEDLKRKIIGYSKLPLSIIFVEMTETTLPNLRSLTPTKPVSNQNFNQNQVVDKNLGKQMRTILTLVNYNYHKMIDFDEFTNALFANTASEMFQYFLIKNIPPESAPGLRYGEEIVIPENDESKLTDGIKGEANAGIEATQGETAAGMMIVGGWGPEDYKLY